MTNIIDVKYQRTGESTKLNTMGRQKIYLD
jgi:hypothetical protein